tara:strand:- start:125 stop:847 length:723 start_codon:yes stop_codon:yes gene_type:complete
MIKFFRKIRQNLLVENKTGKYLKYAFGEIVLVVIGILIALSVNNWNEKRKLNDTIKGVYSIVKSDLLSDIETIDKVLVATQFKDSIFKQVINRKITRDDYLKCYQCMQILYGFPDMKLKTRGLKLLEEDSAVLNSFQDSLSIEINNFYSFYNTEIDASIQEVWDDFNDNLYYFKNNKPWFTDYINSKVNSEFIEYALTSTDYINRVNHFYIVYYTINLGHLKEYRKDAFVLIENINREID